MVWGTFHWINWLFFYLNWLSDCTGLLEMYSLSTYKRQLFPCLILISRPSKPPWKRAQRQNYKWTFPILGQHKKKQFSSPALPFSSPPLLQAQGVYYIQYYESYLWYLYKSSSTFKCHFRNHSESWLIVRCILISLVQEY